MFVKRFIKNASLHVSIPSGNLKALQLKPQLAVHHGVPHTSAVVAFEPVQRLLAVSTSDGRTKILGAVGLEKMLQSPAHFPCKYLEFLNNRGFLVRINTRNDIELWDVDKRELVYFQKWEAEIMSFSVMQGSAFMFVGDQSGAVFVLHFLDEEQQLNIMPYVIPAHITLGGLIGIGSSEAPSVIGVLPQPDVYFTRLLVAYGNGLIILWGLHETQVVAVRGGTEGVHMQLSEFAASLKGRAIPVPSKQKETDEEEEKEICCVCWVCPVGSVLAAGYVDGEILLWTFPTIISGKGQVETEFVDGPLYSHEPAHSVDLAPGKTKMPVVGLTWGASAGLGAGVGGRLYVFGGKEVDLPQAVTVISLDSLTGQQSAAKLLQVELNLPGPFADMALLPEPGGSLATPAAALVLLMHPGVLHVFDEPSLANHFAALAEGTPSPFPEPVPFQLTVTETKITCAQLVLLSNDGLPAKVLQQVSQATKTSPLAPSLASTKWPISGGAPAPSSSGQDGDKSLYITGHEDGVVKFWDASSQSYDLICTVESESKLDPVENSEVTRLEFYASSGMLAFGCKNGRVFLYKLLDQECQMTVHFVSLDDSSAKEEPMDYAPGFGCIMIESVHSAPISALSISGGPPRLAVGDESGMVSLVDLHSHSVTFYDNCFPAPILSVVFSSEALGSDATPMALSPRSPSFSKRKPAPSALLGHVIVLYVIGKDASMVAIDGTTGALFGSGAMQPKNPSTAVSLHLLEAGGTPVTTVKVEPNDLVRTAGTSDQADANDAATASVRSEAMEKTTSPEDQIAVSPGRGKCSEAQFLLLCCTDSLRLYSAAAVLQGLRTTSQKIKLEKICCWTATFSSKSGVESGLILVYTSGDLEIRSLPDLGLLMETSLSSILNWKVELSPDSLRSMASNINGQLAWTNHDSEIIHISVLEDDTTRDDIPLPLLYDMDVARAADAAITYERSVSKKKQFATPIQGLLSGMMKELKNVLDIDHEQVVHKAAELPKLFSSSPFTVVSLQSTSADQDASGSANKAPLDIDDIEVDNVEVEPQQPTPPDGQKSNKFAERFTGAIKSLKGKEKSDEESNRIKLFDSKDAPRPSKAQTVDDIRAKYGHPRKSQEIAGAMDIARNKLAERGEKLQDIGDKTAELENNAENFASMAEELARRVSRKKWWEL